MKKIMSLVLSLALCLTCVVPAYAVEVAEANNEITVDEYIETLTAEYAKFHMDLEITPTREDIVCTQAMLDNALAELYAFIDRSNYDPTTGTFIHIDERTSNSNRNFIQSSEQSIILRSTPYTRSYTSDCRIEPPAPAVGYAYIRTEINTTEDVQSGNFISINSETSYQYGWAQNYDGWVETSNTLHIHQTANNVILGVVYGRLTVSWTDPSGFKHTNTSNQAMSVYITCGS